MPQADMFGIVLGSLNTAIWSWLLTRRGAFWRSGPVLDAPPSRAMPAVTVIIPARNEEEHIEGTLRSLLHQQYAGPLRVVLVDDHSTDATAIRAEALARLDPRLRVVHAQTLPPGWTGKLWAISQGLAQPEAAVADFVLFTDADIVHGPLHLAALVGKAEHAALDLVSEMVRLRTETLAERALIPAFVFFFQMLYPFRWVNDPARSEAAAAGGTMLVSRAALHRISGVDRIRTALIDDVALARTVKRDGHTIWLGHAEHATSMRQYATAAHVWQMIARTAYVQLNHSPLLLVATVAGMWLVYAQPVALALRAKGAARLLGVVSWSMMATAFQPTLKRYRRSPLWGFALPAIALFYMGATVGSAIQCYRGRGGHWKGRTYPAQLTAR